MIVIGRYVVYELPEVIAIQVLREPSEDYVIGSTDSFLSIPMPELNSKLNALDFIGISTGLYTPKRLHKRVLG